MTPVAATGREDPATLPPETQIVATPAGWYGATLLSSAYQAVVARCESPVSFWELAAALRRSPAALDEMIEDLHAQGLVAVIAPDTRRGHSSEVLRRIISRLAALS
jgi:hypothetical protein